MFLTTSLVRPKNKANNKTQWPVRAGTECNFHNKTGENKKKIDPKNEYVIEFVSFSNIL